MEYRIWDKIMCKHSTSGLWSISPDGSVYYGNALWPEAEIELFTGHYDNTKWEELTESERERFVRHNNPSEWRGKKIYEGDVVFAESNFDSANMVVIWDNAKFVLVDIEKYQNYESGAGYKEIQWLNKKIIGNIHNEEFSLGDE